MAFKRSSVRSRLAPPEFKKALPHRQGLFLFVRCFMDYAAVRCGRRLRERGLPDPLCRDLAGAAEPARRGAFWLLPAPGPDPRRPFLAPRRLRPAIAGLLSASIGAFATPSE